MNAFRRWEDLSVREQLLCVYSDAYKDVYGCRPRGTDDMTIEELQAQVNYLTEAIEQQESDRRQEEIQAQDRFENRVRGLILSGAGDRATALLWLHREYQTGGDTEYLCFRLGLPYDYLAAAA